MLPLYLEYFLKLKIAEIFGNLPVNENNNVKNIPYKKILIDTKNHNNNLIGKVVLNNFMFYYIPIKLLENYENNSIGIPICYHIDICPFCFGIQLEIENQIKLYKLIKDSEDSEEIKYMNSLIKNKFCFDMVKN